VKNEAGNNDEEFFVTGLEKYLDAKSAVTMFEHEVQGLVKNVLKKYQADFRALFGDDWSLRDYSGTSEKPECSYLGKQVNFKGVGIFYFYFTFSRNEDGVSVLRPTAMLWRERVTLLTSLWKSIDESRSQFPNLVIRNDKFWLTGSHPVTDRDSCENALDEIIVEWIKVWRTLGGLQNYLVAQGTAT